MSYWQYVPGPDINKALYDQIVESATESDVIVETQVGFGRGLHYLLEGLAARNVRPKVYAFDTFGETHAHSEHWEGHPQATPWGEPHAQWAARLGGPSRLIDQFAFHLANNPASSHLTDWAQFPHWTVAEEFPSESVTYIILNGPADTKRKEYDFFKWADAVRSGGDIRYVAESGPWTGRILKT